MINEKFVEYVGRIKDYVDEDFVIAEAEDPSPNKSVIPILLIGDYHTTMHDHSIKAEHDFVQRRVAEIVNAFHQGEGLCLVEGSQEEYCLRYAPLIFCYADREIRKLRDELGIKSSVLEGCVSDSLSYHYKRTEPYASECSWNYSSLLDVESLPFEVGPKIAVLDAFYDIMHKVKERAFNILNELGPELEWPISEKDAELLTNLLKLTDFQRGLGKKVRGLNEERNQRAGDALMLYQQRPLSMVIGPHHFEWDVDNIPIKYWLGNNTPYIFVKTSKKLDERIKKEEY